MPQASLLKKVAIAVGGLSAILLIAGVVLYLVGGSRIGKVYDVEVANLVVPNGGDAIERGRHLATHVTLCHGCHGDRLEGMVIFDEPVMATIYAPNLTSGNGGIGPQYSDEDFVRAIRNGINREGRGLMIMHSDAYNRLGAYDLAALISYVKSVPPVDNVVPAARAGVVGHLMVGLGLVDTETMPFIPAERIDHSAPIPGVPESVATPEYGEYLVSVALCRMCHGADLKGGPPIEEGAPPGPDITGYGEPGDESFRRFLNTIRTGVTEDGRVLNPEIMPWAAYQGMTDEELTAIHLYLQEVRRD